jgi:nitrite reductase (NADH) small subunit
MRIFVCEVDDLEEGGVHILKFESTKIGVYRHRGAFYAYKNLCAHQGGPVCEGRLMNRVVERLNADKTYIGEDFDADDPHIVCSWHGWEYRLLTGENAANPNIRLQQYEVMQQDNKLYLEV